MDPLTLCMWQTRVLWLVLGVGWSLAVATLQLWRTRRYLKEALAREQRMRIGRERSMVNDFCRSYSELQRSLLKSFMQEPTPTLESLVARTEQRFQAKASARQSVPPPVTEEDTVELRTTDLIQPSQDSRVTPRGSKW